MSKKIKLTVEDVVKALTEAAADHDIDPGQVTTAMLNDINDSITPWNLRQVGGLALIKKTHFKQEKNLGEIYNQKQISSYIGKLERQVGEVESLSERIADAVITNIKPVKITPYKPPKKAKKPTNKTELVAMMNDLHIGLNVRPEEVNGINEYNFLIASRRAAFFINEVCDFKRYKRDQVDTLHLCLNGDLIGGIIHGLLGRDYELLTFQFNGAVHILANVVARASENFKNVKVYFSTGNHGDSPHRREGGRVISQIYDSIEGQVFYAVSIAHSKTNNVQFEAGYGLYQDVMLPAGRAAFTHGHIMFSKALGNPGTAINNKSLGNAIADFNSGEVSRGKPPVKLLLFGHTHVKFSLVTKDGTLVYNAPSMSGVDSFAHSIGINHNLTEQLMFETTSNHIMGDSRMLNVSDADKDPSFDKIIHPYGKELVYRK